MMRVPVLGDPLALDLHLPLPKGIADLEPSKPISLPLGSIWLKGG